MAEIRESSKNLERKIFLTMGVLGFIGTLLCFSPNLTGNVIGNLSNNSLNLLGFIFLAIGIASVWIAMIRD